MDPGFEQGRFTLADHRSRRWGRVHGYVNLPVVGVLEVSTRIAAGYDLSVDPEKAVRVQYAFEFIQGVLTDKPKASKSKKPS